MLRNKTFAFLLVVALMIPAVPATAGGSHGVSVRVRVSRSWGARPVCPVGFVHPGCFAPARKSARFAGRVAVGAARGVARAGFRAARFTGRVARGAIRGTGRLLFGRRFRC